MTRVVVDASIAVKWFVPEEHWAKARSILSVENEMLAPDILPVEVVNALLKKQRRREIDDRIVVIGANRTLDLVSRTSSTPLISQALDIAFRYKRSVYDSLYVALALQEGCPLVTADRRLYDALAPYLNETLLWVEDLA